MFFFRGSQTPISNLIWMIVNILFISEYTLLVVYMHVYLEVQDT